MATKLKVGIIGIGMVGDPIRRWFEEKKGYRPGKELFCYDADPKKGYSDDVNKADVIFVSVPTPSNPDGSCNTSIVDVAVSTIKDGKIVVVKSTIVPGTVERLQKKHPKKKFIFNPEFLTESQVWEDYISPDRQILGTTNKSTTDVLEVLALLPQKHFVRPWSSDYAKKSVNATEAEMGKYASNVFGYMKVIFGNIMADACYALGKVYVKEGIKSDIDYENIREMLGADLRIGPGWLNVDHGVYNGAGGYCFPKDMNAFIHFLEDTAEKMPKGKKQDKEFLAVFQKGIAAFKAIRAYNEALIKAQGLTMADVMRHSKEIITDKRKPVRV